jgi:ABC-type glycerol-3-phosphate transport system substrate-binding protein
VENPVSVFSATAGQVLAITANSKNKKEAKEFLQYIYSEEAQKIITDKGYYSSLITANTGDTSVRRMIISHLEMADDDSIMIYDNLEPKMLENLTRILQDVLEGRVKSSEAWDRVLKLTYQQ